jgi:hypothetical protein
MTTTTTETTIHRGARWDGTDAYGQCWWTIDSDHAARWGQVKTVTMPAGLKAITLTVADLDQADNAPGADGLEIARMIKAASADVALLPGWEGEMTIYVADASILGIETEEIDEDAAEEMADFLGTTWSTWNLTDGRTYQELQAEAAEYGWS